MLKENSKLHVMTLNHTTSSHHCGIVANNHSELGHKKLAASFMTQCCWQQALISTALLFSDGGDITVI